MKLADRILCCCSGGKVRSIAAKYLLEDYLDCTDVLAVGLNKAAPVTLEMLCSWSQHILVCGQKKLTKLVPADYRGKVIHLDIGADVWGTCYHPKLLRKLEPMLKGLFA